MCTDESYRGREAEHTIIVELSQDQAQGVFGALSPEYGKKGRRITQSFPELGLVTGDCLLVAFDVQDLWVELQDVQHVIAERPVKVSFWRPGGAPSKFPNPLLQVRGAGGLL